MAFFKYLRRLLSAENEASQHKEKGLMNAPFWGGFYDRSKEEKQLFTKERKNSSDN